MSTLTAPTQTGTYTIDPTHSRIGFVARHAMVTKVRGSFNEFEGSGYFDAENPTNSRSSMLNLPFASRTTAAVTLVMRHLLLSDASFSTRPRWQRSGHDPTLPASRRVRFGKVDPIYGDVGLSAKRRGSACGTPSASCRNTA